MSAGTESYFQERSGDKFDEIVSGLTAESHATDDPARATASGVIAERLRREPPLAEALVAFATVRRAYDLPEKLNLIHSSFLYIADHLQQAVPRTAEENQALFDSVNDIWATGVGESGGPEDQAMFERLQTALFFNDLQTNVISRYGPAEVLMQANARRFPAGGRVLDVGSSIGLGVKALALKETVNRRMRFPYTSVRDEHNIAHPVYTRAYNDMLERPSWFVEGVGLDIQDVRDPETIRWAIANLRHAERLNPDFMESCQQYLDAEAPNVTFHKGDCTDEADMARLTRTFGGKKFELVIANTVLYQMARTELANALRFMGDSATDNGLLVVQDSVEPTGSDIIDLQLTPGNWKNWTTLVYDNANPDNGWQPVFYSEKSRFRSIRLAAGRLAIDGTLQTPAEWLTA